MSNRAPVKKRRISEHSPSLAFERDELSDESSDRVSEDREARVEDFGGTESDLNTDDDEVVVDETASIVDVDKSGRNFGVSAYEDGASRFDRGRDNVPRRLASSADLFEQNVLETSSEDDDDVDEDEFSGSLSLQDDDGDNGEEEDGEEDNASEPQPDSMDGGAEYQQFLRAILADDDAPTTANLPAASLLDDEEGDIDFDYLTASAEIVEDPLEFRNDKTVHVTRREIVSLVAGNPERRRRRPRALPTFPLPSSKPSPSVTPSYPPSLSGPVEAGNLLSGVKDSNWNALSQTPVASGSMVPEAHFPPIHAVPILQPNGVVLTDAQFWAQHVLVLQQQLNTHVLLLASVRSKAQESSVKNKSERLLKELIGYRDASRHFKGIFDPIRQRFENPLYSISEAETYFAVPALEVVERFLAEAASGREDVARCMATLQPFADQHVASALLHRGKSLPLSGERDIPWTVEDDALLALLIAKYSMDFGNNALTLLPFRSVVSCEKRMRYLASRRCRDNPVKAQVLEVTSNVKALSATEVGIISDAIARLEPNHSIDDLDWRGPEKEVWQRIQQEYLPHRDWRQMEKLWTWRQSRRRYKRNEKRKRKEQRANAARRNV